MKREQITDTSIALPLLASKTLDEKLLSLRSGAKLAPRPSKKKGGAGGKNSTSDSLPARAGPLSHGSGFSLASGGRRSGESGSGGRLKFAWRCKFARFSNESLARFLSCTTQDTNKLESHIQIARATSFLRTGQLKLEKKRNKTQPLAFSPRKSLCFS